MVAAVAKDDPQMAPKPAQAPMAAIATPPLRWPSHVSEALNSAADMPPKVAKCPMSKNSGMMENE